LRGLEAVELLRRVWLTEFEFRQGRVRLREPKSMPPMGQLIETPYAPEARYCTKRELHWTGYRVHLTESCEAALPHLITHVETTVASTQDIEQLPAIHAGLAEQQLLPAEHVVDAGYVSGRTLAASRAAYQVDLLGPIVGDHRWQAHAGQGFDAAHFEVDWDARVVTCPQGHRSARWCVMHTARQRPMVHVAFAPEDCTPCPARPLCTRAKTSPRHLTLQVQAEHEAIQAARQRQATPEFAARYACRAGVEGTLSQGVRAFGLRRARYRGLRKTHLQHLATAAAMNVRRLDAWLQGVPVAATRCSHFASLAT
jgi:transposase